MIIPSIPASRFIATELEKDLKQTLTLVNRTGGSGAVRPGTPRPCTERVQGPRMVPGSQSAICGQIITSAITTTISST